MSNFQKNIRQINSYKERLVTMKATRRMNQIYDIKKLYNLCVVFEPPRQKEIYHNVNNVKDTTIHASFAVIGPVA